MYVTLKNTYGSVDFNTAHYEQFKSFVAGHQKIHAIKMIREIMPSWGLKECKDFVENCYFPPQPATESKEDDVFLREVKADLRDILVSGSDYREPLIIDLFARVCAKVGLAR